MRGAALASLLAVVTVAAAPARAQDASMAFGSWVVESRSAQIELYRCPDAQHGPICGRVSRLIDPKMPDGTPVPEASVKDLNNPNPALRERPVVGMVLLWGFKLGPDGKSFEEGTIYNGEDGKTYRATMTPQPDGTLKLRGYVGTPLFGKTQVWTRAQ
jgi:uncharacterized protein (DUF2147 family)